jgi:hypothetical protein
MQLYFMPFLMPSWDYTTLFYLGLEVAMTGGDYGDVK